MSKSRRQDGVPRRRSRRSLAFSLLTVAPVFVLLLGMVAVLSYSRASRLTSGAASVSASGVVTIHEPMSAGSTSTAPKALLQHGRGHVLAPAHHHHRPPGSPSPSASASASPSASATASAPPPSVTDHSNCSSEPHACGFPDGTNTGVPAGMNLLTVPGQVSKGTGWHYDSRGWVEVTGNGAVLKGLSIPYNVDVSASNVTIEDTRIEVTGDSFGVSLRHTQNVTIADSEIYSPDATGSGRLMVGIKDIYGDATGTVVNGDNIYHTSTGVQMSTGTIENSYIHDLGFTSGDHLNGITSNAGGNNFVIEHNTVFNNYQQTDAIGLFEDFGSQYNCLIENNLLAGGGYTLYGGANPGGAATSNIRVIDNRFAKLYHSNSGYYGPVTAFSGGGSGNEWTGNVWDNDNQALRA
jgi:phage baseplate assembly protein gpV